MDDDGLVSVQHKGRIDKNNRWNGIKNKVIDCIKYSKDVDAEYDKRTIYDGEILNCYGIKKNDGNKGNFIKLGDIFNFEKGTLQSEKNTEGEYNFITASEERKTHIEYDHDCEAIVYAIQASGSLGRSHYVNGKFIASNLCLILTAKKENQDHPINVQFYSIYLNAIRKQVVNELADGTSKLTIAQKDLMDYYVESLLSH